MAEDKTFRYGLIVLGFFLVMIGMFIMSVDRPHVYITFCSMGVLMVFIGITWSICQCYPKITFTPVDMEAVALTEKSLVHTNNFPPEKQWSTTPYTTSKEAERYETSLPSYEQIQIKVEEPGEGKEDESIPALVHPMLMDCSYPTVQAKAEIHRNCGNEKNRTSSLPGVQEKVCQPDFYKEAPLASLKEDTNITCSDDGKSSCSSLQSCDLRQSPVQCNPDCEVHFGNNSSYEGISLIDSPLYEGIGLHWEQGIASLPSQEISTDSKEHNFYIADPAQDPDMDDMHYGLKDEMDNVVTTDESDLEE
ncbi:barttin [Rhinophrynus dorsalis]